MAMAPEPILDVVRALSTVASFTIVVQQLKTMYDTFYIGLCERCRGTGIVTCPHCHGTKLLRSRPAYIRARSFAIIDNKKDTYDCYHCGPLTKYDIDPFAKDDEETDRTAIQIMDNLKAAVANSWPKPHEMPIYAGTVACPDCGGDPAIRRFTPDFAKALNLDRPWDRLVRLRMGKALLRREDKPEKRLFLEYPATSQEPQKRFPQPPKTPEEEAEWAAKAEINEFEGYIIPYASDDEE